MKHISILIPKGHTSLVNIAGTHQILSQVNDFLELYGKPQIFNINLVGLSKETKQTHGLFTIYPDFLIDDIFQTDIIIIPAIHGDQKQAIRNNQEFLPWLIKHYNKGAELVSFCIGAFFLAATGLLNGKKCSTHWIHAKDFREMYPEIDLVDDKIMTVSERIYTSGGAYSYLNLLLYLIEKYAGREIAILTAKAFMIDIDREKQSPFIIFQGQKEHTDTQIIKAQEFIENNFHDKITVDNLASSFALSRRSLERRFKKATSNTISEYLQRVRIEAAKKSFETTKKSIYEVMYEVGYNDTKAFRIMFKKITGMSPVDYRKKYNKEAIAV